MAWLGNTLFGNRLSTCTMVYPESFLELPVNSPGNILSGEDGMIGDLRVVCIFKGSENRQMKKNMYNWTSEQISIFYINTSIFFPGSNIIIVNNNTTIMLINSSTNKELKYYQHKRSTSILNTVYTC